jgi:hypothetical protein
LLSQNNLSDRPDHPAHFPKQYRLASYAKAAVRNACIHEYMISYPAALIAVFKDQIGQLWMSIVLYYKT